MRFLKFLALTLVVALGFSSCKPDNGDDHDHTSDLVGTWTCLTENYAEVLIINEDGTAVSYGVEDGEYWENVRGTVVTDGDNITMTFEDNDNLTGHFDIIPGQAFSLFEDSGERYTYQYCANDLSDEIIGMWVSNDGPTDMKNEIQIRTYGKDGIVTTTGVRTIGGNAEWMLNEECEYRVVGDLMFKTRSKEVDGQLKVTHSAERFVYAPKATALGDIMNVLFYLPMGDSYVKSTVSFLRIKQNLELPGNKYDYMKTFVTNVKGEDKDIPFLNTSFNFAKMDGAIIDKFLKSTLFAVEFPDANTFKYGFLVDGQSNSMTAPINVEGNKMTIKMSANGPYHDVDMYTFQDKDNTQMHLYMPTSSFEKFFANTSVYVMLGNGQLDKDDADAIAGVYKTVADAVESINLSLVMTRTK